MNDKLGHNQFFLIIVGAIIFQYITYLNFDGGLTLNYQRSTLLEDVRFSDGGMNI